MTTAALLAVCVLSGAGTTPVQAEPKCSRIAVCPSSAESPRVGEGDAILLKDGRLLLVYSRWQPAATGDDSPADIRCRYSSDGGLAWGPETVLIPNDAMNLMSVSLLRLENGGLMMVYGRRHSNAKMWWYARFSSDESKTWSSDVLMTPEVGYHTINNARVIQLKSGRLLAPATLCRGETWLKDYYFHTIVFYSDDNGRTWKTSGQKVDIKDCSFGADEPGVVELKDGRVMLIARTDLGKIYRCYSSDAGLSWSKPEPMDLDSPISPATVARIPSTGDLLMVWNNSRPDPENKGGPRSPLTAAISSDEGMTWKHIRNLEDAPDGNYCYTSIDFVGKTAVLTYYERGGLKAAVVDVDWFYK